MFKIQLRENNPRIVAIIKELLSCHHAYNDACKVTVMRRVDDGRGVYRYLRSRRRRGSLVLHAFGDIRSDLFIRVFLAHLIPRTITAQDTQDFSLRNIFAVSNDITTSSRKADHGLSNKDFDTFTAVQTVQSCQ